MELLLQREKSSAQSTQGKLFVDGAFECHTLEDPVRDKKIFGQTAIPAGRYHVEITWSDHFGKLLPLIEHVANFDGVRIHSGNTASDTEGCILVGRVRGKDCVSESRLAMKALFDKLDKADDIWLTIEAAK